MSAPAGSWPSPISATAVFTASTSRSWPLADGEDVYWLESRPEHAGRLTLVRRRAGVVSDVSAPGHNVRTRLHEYGGASYAVRDGVVLYVDFATQQVWRAEEGMMPRPITPPSDALVRYAGFAIDRRRGVVHGIREDQRDETLEPVTSLVRLDLDGPNDDFGTVLLAGRERRRDARSDAPSGPDAPPDVVLDPTLSPDGGTLSWVTWSHPNMPWDGTWLWTADLDDAGAITEPALIAGGPDVAVEPAVWLDDQRLAFVSHAGGWGNFHIADLSGETPTVRPLHRESIDYGLPRWQSGMSAYDVLADGRIACVRAVDGVDELAVLDPDGGAVRKVPTAATHLAVLHATARGSLLAVAGSATSPTTVAEIDVATGTTTALAADEPSPDPAWVSVPESVWWDAPSGRTHGFLYPPANPGQTLGEGERPPLLVTLHGGPSGRADPAYSTATAYWTSRGFAILDVNYGGSTGFGDAYRARLDGQWGIVDVEDTVAGVRHLITEGRVDADRVAIRGGSAGGFSVLAALTSSDVFTAGASYFGISDLVTLASDTHKLESRYLQRLVAPWPEARDVYVERSPLTHVDRLAAPLILLQGTDDRVVPPAQAQLMADVLREKDLPHELIMFEGEGHGFRDPANNIRALESELAFYQKVFAT